MKKVVILGAGCSGLSVAWGLTEKGGCFVTLLESATRTGGLSRTLARNGIRFDIGPHRFSPQLPDVVERVQGLLDGGLVEHENLHGVYFKGSLYTYPPRMRDLLHGRALRITALFGASWLTARAAAAVRRFLGRTREPSFDRILVDSFGADFCREVVFPMMRKVWGTTDLHHEFSAIRFNVLTVGRVLQKILFRKSSIGNERFYYPAHGFGQLCEAMERLVHGRGQSIETGARIQRIEARSLSGPFTVWYAAGGAERAVEADIIVSTVPNSDLLAALSGTGLIDALLPLAEKFRSRTLRLGILTVKGFRLPSRVVIFPEARYPFNRISAMDHFSDLGNPPGHAVLMVDVICDPGSAIDRMDEGSFEQAVLASVLDLGWFSRGEVTSLFSVRVPRAYPVLSHER